MSDSYRAASMIFVSFSPSGFACTCGHCREVDAATTTTTGVGDIATVHMATGDLGGSWTFCAFSRSSLPLLFSNTWSSARCSRLIRRIAIPATWIPENDADKLMINIDNCTGEVIIVEVSVSVSYHKTHANLLAYWSGVCLLHADDIYNKLILTTACGS